MTDRIPKKTTIWSGAILGGIVNATMTAQSAGYQAFRYWYRNHYYVHGGDGREGTITFAGGHWYENAPLVAVFHNLHSDIFKSNEVDLASLFIGCSQYQRWLADQLALPSLRLPFCGQVLHRVTSVFWDHGERLQAAFPWIVTLANGADLAAIELIEDIDSAFSSWQDDYGMTPEQLSFVREVFQKKMARPPALIELTQGQIDWLDSVCGDNNPTEAHRIWREMFLELGIVEPEDTAK